jgi:hypothetical protein
MAMAIAKDVFSAQRGVVAQICNLPYRRFVIGGAFESSSTLLLADVPQNAILRYSRLQICATPKTYIPKRIGVRLFAMEVLAKTGLAFNTTRVYTLTANSTKYEVTKGAHPRFFERAE